MAWPERTDIASHDGVTKTLGEWAEQLDVPFQAFSHKLVMHRMNLDKLFPEHEPDPITHPELIRPTRAMYGEAPKRLFTFDGDTLTLAEWSERTGLSERLLRNRIYSRWSLQRALTTAAKISGRATKVSSEQTSSCGHPATDTAPLPGGESGLSEDIGDRRGIICAINSEIGVFA